MSLRFSRPGRYWLSMIGLIASQPGGMGRALYWLWMYATARIVPVRRIVFRLASQRPQRVAAPGQSIFDGDISALAESLRADGFDARLRLPSPVVRELFRFGAGVTTRIPYSRGRCSDISAIERIAKDPTLRELAALYLGASPIYRGSRAWWTGLDAVADPRETGAWFHYDLYDFRALVFLFYLNDVDSESGPHVVVRASHRLRKWRDQLHPRRYRSDQEILRTYGAERIITLCGPAGTVIAEDPFCFHKVKPPTRRARLTLQLLYTGNDFPAPSFRIDGRSRPQDKD